MIAGKRSFTVAAIAENADVTLLHVGVNPTRTGVIDVGVTWAIS